MQKPLSRRESQIAALIVKGKRDREIAALLGVTLHTERSYVKTLFRKLGVQKRTALGAAALGLIGALPPSAVPAARLSDGEKSMRLHCYALYKQALKRGFIIRQACEVCGSAAAEGHHEDYMEPLKVRWLCLEHHRAAHVTFDRVPVIESPS